MGRSTFTGNERSTHISTEDGETRVVYHATTVVRFDADLITLYTGGYSTYTTKHRMNQASESFDLGYKVWQKGFQWFVDLPCGETVEFLGRVLIIDRATGKRVD